ncbi:MAG: protein kinase domain-containing protein [Burkholderiales bacterium]
MTVTFDPDATVSGVEADADATIVRTRILVPALSQDTERTKTPRPRSAPPRPLATLPKRTPLATLPKRTPLTLPAGFRLHEYRIDRVLGQGGFGVTYLATDVNLNAPVAIKEYMPEEIAFRTADSSVMPNATRHRDRYQQGLESFLVEAQTLATFRHSSIVRVARFFEAHHTAYMVLDYVEGAPFKKWWPEHQSIGEKELVELLHPLLDGLAAVHAAGFLHRDIKPDNIQVRTEDGRLVLLDFGSAGKAVALADESSVVVTPGYAPIEQYGLGEQGPWTDLYALAATLHWAITGRRPADAEIRATDPLALVPAAQAGSGRFGAAFLAAIDWALQSDPASRPRTVAEFRRALFADHSASLGLQEVLKQGDAPKQGGLARMRRAFSPGDWPLALKLTLAMLATALLPMLITAGYNLRGSLDAVSAGELRYVEQMAHSTAGRVGQLIADSRHFARSLGTDDDFAVFLAEPTDDGKSVMRAKLERLTQANPDVQLIILMDAAGVAIVSSDPAVMGRNFAFRQYFKEAIAGRSFASGLVVGAVAGAAGMFYAEPVRKDDAIIGAIVLRIRASSFSSILDEARTDSTLTPFLLDGDGVMIHHPRKELLYQSLMPLPASTLAEIRADQRFRRDNIESLDMPELARAMVGTRENGHVSYRSNITKQPEIAGFAPVPGHNWVVGITESRAAFEEPLNTLYTHLMWSVVLIGLLFTGLALAFSRTIVRPIRRLTEAVHALEKGDFDRANVPPGSRDELGQLTRTFNVMIGVLRERERERERRRS